MLFSEPGHMKILEIDRPPLEGALNYNVLAETYPATTLGLVRHPKINKIIMDSIGEEYGGVGFTRYGGRFRRRNQMEQIAFARHAASQGLRVICPTHVDSRGVPFYPFLENAMSWDNYLISCPEGAEFEHILNLYGDMRKAHSRGIVYGDRWYKNILVDPRSGVVHIDFDIEISGDMAKEFEVAQVTYYTLLAAKGRKQVIPFLTEILQRSDWFDITKTLAFVQRHSNYFKNDAIYGGLAEEVNTMIELIQKQ